MNVALLPSLLLYGHFFLDCKFSFRNTKTFLHGVLALLFLIISLAVCCSGLIFSYIGQHVLFRHIFQKFYGTKAFILFLLWKMVVYYLIGNYFPSIFFFFYSFILGLLSYFSYQVFILVMWYLFLCIKITMFYGCFVFSNNTQSLKYIISSLLNYMFSQGSVIVFDFHFSLSYCAFSKHIKVWGLPILRQLAWAAGRLFLYFHASKCFFFFRQSWSAVVRKSYE